jgi:hypothetical protein
MLHADFRNGAYHASPACRIKQYKSHKPHYHSRPRFFGNIASQFQKAKQLTI